MDASKSLCFKYRAILAGIIIAVYLPSSRRPAGRSPRNSNPPRLYARFFFLQTHTRERAFERKDTQSGVDDLHNRRVAAISLNSFGFFPFLFHIVYCIFRQCVLYLLSLSTTVISILSSAIILLFSTYLFSRRSI